MHQPKQRVLKTDLDVELRQDSLLQETASVARDQSRDECNEDQQDKTDDGNLECPFLLNERRTQVSYDSLKERFA